MDDSPDRRRCTGKNRAGKRCGRAPAKHQAVCSFHGAKAPQTIRKAAQRRLEQEIRTMSEMYVAEADPVADPLVGLLKVAGEIAGFKDFMAARVAEMRSETWRYEGMNSEQLRSEIALYERALDRTAKVLVDISKLGLEERQVRLAERHAALLADCMRRVLDRLELSPEQRVLAGTVVPEEFRRIGDQDRQALEAAVTK